MDRQLATYVFQHGAVSGGIVQNVVVRGQHADIGLRHFAHINIARRGHRLGDVRTRAQQIQRNFPRRNRLVAVRGVDRLVLGIAGEVEAARPQAFFIHAIDDDRHIEAIGADDAVLGRPMQTRVVVGHGAGELFRTE